MTDLPRYSMELSDNERDIFAVPEKGGASLDADLHFWLNAADVSSRLQQLERLLAALDETDVEDAIAQIEFDVKRSVDVANEIKQLESWPPNSWPSMNDRTIYSTLLHRAKGAEERLQQLEQEKATLLDRLERFSECASFACPYETRMQTAEAALAETREALQLAGAVLKRIGATSDGSYWRKEIDDVLARVDKPADSLSVVLQPPVGDTSADR